MSSQTKSTKVGDIVIVETWGKPIPYVITEDDGVEVLVGGKYYLYDELNWLHDNVWILAAGK